MHLEGVEIDLLCFLLHLVPPWRRMLCLRVESVIQIALTLTNIVPNITLFGRDLVYAVFLWPSAGQAGLATVAFLEPL